MDEYEYGEYEDAYRIADATLKAREKR